MYTCPVCGYDSLREPPKDWCICPSCGCHFGYSDAGTSHDSLRTSWIEEGYTWHSTVRPKPEGWNARKQLENIGI